MRIASLTRNTLRFSGGPQNQSSVAATHANSHHKHLPLKGSMGNGLNLYFYKVIQVIINRVNYVLDDHLKLKMK